MSNLIRQIPELELVARIKDASNLSNQLKAARRMSGASGQLNYSGQSGNDWDITQTITGGSMTKITFTVTMACDGSQDWPEAILYMDMRANGTADANRFTYLTSVPNGSFYYAMLGWTDATNANIIAYGGRNRTYNSVTKTFTWTVDFYYSGTITYSTKIVLRSTCPGAVSLARTI